jgi:hypothetical protein
MNWIEVLMVSGLWAGLIVLVIGSAMRPEPEVIDTVRCLCCHRPRIPQVINPGNGLCVQCEAEIRGMLAGEQKANDRSSV